MMPKGSTSIAAALALGLFALVTVPVTAQPEDARLSPATHRELAVARAATARYHDVAQAEADGYVNINLYEPGEGFHWVKPSLVDGVFDPAQPEILLYAHQPGDDQLRLVAVEYIVPLTLSPGAAPSGFTGTADGWREDSETFGMWELTVWIWQHNPDGLFSQLNPRVP